MSYKDASTLGQRQVDIPKTLAVQGIKNNPSTAVTVSDTTMTSTKDSFLAEMKAAQADFQIKYDEKLAKLDETIARRI